MVPPQLILLGQYVQQCFSRTNRRSAQRVQLALPGAAPVRTTVSVTQTTSILCSATSTGYRATPNCRWWTRRRVRRSVWPTVPVIHWVPGCIARGFERPDNGSGQQGGGVIDLHYQVDDEAIRDLIREASVGECGWSSGPSDRGTRSSEFHRTRQAKSLRLRAKRCSAKPTRTSVGNDTDWKCRWQSVRPSRAPDKPEQGNPSGASSNLVTAPPNQHK